MEDSEGGPLAFPLPRLALFTLYGDGRFVTTNPLPIGGPPLAPPTLRVGRLSVDGVQRVLQTTGGRYLAWFQPLLPHEHGCADARV